MGPIRTKLQKFIFTYCNVIITLRSLRTLILLKYEFRKINYIEMSYIIKVSLNVTCRTMQKSNSREISKIKRLLLYLSKQEEDLHISLAVVVAFR